MKLTKLALALGMSVFGSAVIAAPIPLPVGLIQLSDNNAEYLVNADPDALDTTLDIGDRLRGIFTIETIEGLNPSSPEVDDPWGGNYLSGIFDIVVTAKSGSAINGYDFTFAAAGTLNTVGAAVEIYFDSEEDYSRTGDTIANLEANVLDGSLWAALGFGGASFWTADAVSDDIGTIGAIVPPAIGGTFNSGLDFFVNNTGYEFNKQECVFTGSNLFNDVCASGSLLGTGGADTPYDSFSNVDFTLNRVPTPGPLALLGLGLVVAAISRRRRAAV